GPGEVLEALRIQATLLLPGPLGSASRVPSAHLTDKGCPGLASPSALGSDRSCVGWAARSNFLCRGGAVGRRSHGAQARGGRGCPGGVCRESQPLRLWAPGSGAALLAVRGEHRCFSLPSESPQPEPGSPGTPHARSRRAAASAAGGLRGAGVRGSPARCAALTAASSVCASGERLEVIQQEVADLLKGRILVGHALRNDLKVLFLDHPKKKIRDTQKYKPFKSQVKSGRPSLKLLAEKLLGIRVQEAEHCSIQDAQTAMRLYILAKKEWERTAQDRRPAAPAPDAGHVSIRKRS
uniref:Exonuclease domain-containing protein n=1 Tax=Neovison vison TaxID=452646 RepID=A0A8C7BRI3_NEOVI